MPFLWSFATEADPARPSHALIGSYHLLDRDYRTDLEMVLDGAQCLYLEHDTTTCFEADAVKRALVKDHLDADRIETIHHLLDELGVNDFDIRTYPVKEITSAIRVLLYRSVGAVHRMEETALEIATENEVPVAYLEPRETVERIDISAYTSYLNSLAPLSVMTDRLRRVMDDYYSGDLARSLGFDPEAGAPIALAAELVAERDPPMWTALATALEQDRSAAEKAASGGGSKLVVMVGLTHCCYLLSQLDAAGYHIERQRSISE